MPLATIVSAISRTSRSLMLLANVFQLFQPIGGVWARSSNFWAKHGVTRVTATSNVKYDLNIVRLDCSDEFFRRVRRQRTLPITTIYSKFDLKVATRLS